MMPRPLRILCVPFVPVLGQPQRNQKTLQDLAQKVTSLENPPDVVVLPELALSGYLMESVTALAALEYKEIVQMAALLDPAGSCEWILGLPLREGNAIFNAAAVCKAGKVCHLHRKIFLPTYGMFDEARYFHRGNGFTTYEGTCGRTAVMICEDAWHA
ncbi:MAG: hypothetical protein NZL89_05630, partial [Leptospiraceae bacterium]|nr:hypothetical protein [Leptospiraceae bacterium]